MLYTCVLLYVALIYIRPAEIIPAWGTIPFVDIVTVISGVIAVFSIAAKPRSFFSLPHDKLIVAFWAIIAVSSIKVWLSGAFYAWLAFMPVIVCYFLIRAAVTSQRHLSGLIYMLIGLNIFLAINGIVQKHTGIGLGNIEMRFDRIYGTGIFNDPNDLGMTFVMTVPFLLVLVGRSSAWLLFRILAIPALATLLVALYYTNSRGAIIGLVAAIGCLSLLRYKTIAGTVVALALLGVIVIAAPSRGAQMDSGESSAQSRIQSWAEGWAMFKMHPVTGVGFGQYTEYHSHVAHNSFVHTFAELGLLGAFCFVGMFYWYFKGLNLVPGNTAETIPWRRALIASGVGVLTCGWFLSRQYVPVYYVLLAAGACASNMSLPAESTARLRIDGPSTLKVLGLTFAGLTLVYLSIRTLAIWGGAS